jgi:hypothetical protein
MPLQVVRIDWAPNWREQLYRVGEPYLSKAADRVLDAMRVEIPKSADGSGDRPPGYAASKLRTLERGRMTTGEPYRDVGTDAVSEDGANYPAMLQYGTKPHTITPKAPGYPLRDPRTGRVFGYRVQHPGTRATRASMVINGARL